MLNSLVKKLGFPIESSGPNYRVLNTQGEYTECLGNRTTVKLELLNDRLIWQDNPNWGSDIGFLIICRAPVSERIKQKFEKTYNFMTRPRPTPRWDVYGPTPIMTKFHDSDSLLFYHERYPSSDPLTLKYVTGMNNQVLWGYVDNHNVPDIYIITWLKEIIPKRFLTAERVIIYPRKHDWTTIDGYTPPRAIFQKGEEVVLHDGPWIKRRNWPIACRGVIVQPWPDYVERRVEYTFKPKEKFVLNNGEVINVNLGNIKEEHLERAAYYFTPKGGWKYKDARREQDRIVRMSPEELKQEFGFEEVIIDKEVPDTWIHYYGVATNWSIHFLKEEAKQCIERYGKALLQIRFDRADINTTHYTVCRPKRLEEMEADEDVTVGLSQ